MWLACSRSPRRQSGNGSSVASSRDSRSARVTTGAFPCQQQATTRLNAMEPTVNEKIKFCFIDIEGTGLDAQRDVPLELGLSLVDADLNIITSKKWLIRETSDAYLLGVQRGVRNSFVNEMHTKSGLWDG